jgi:C-terminal processing protease CtpA/Prc
MIRSFSLLILLFLTILIALAAPVVAEDKPFGGVGLQVVPTINGDLVVLNVLENAPAAEKGLLPGDLIFQVDEFPLQGSEFGKVVSEYLWGPVDSKVELYYRRPGVAGVNRVDPRLTVTPSVQNVSPGNAGGN